MSGYVGDLSPKQEEALKLLKARVGDLLQERHDDKEMLRWLRARSFDVKKSEKMFRDSMAFRKKHKLDTILQDYVAPEVLAKYSIGGLAGVDKEGSPLWIDCFGKLDLKGMCYSAKTTDIVLHRLHKIEHSFTVMEEQSKKFGKDIDTVSIITDMEGINHKFLWQPAIELGIELLKCVEANYPERLKVCYVVNAPKIFPVVYNMVKGFMSEDTKSKIVILGSNWKSKLLKYIDADQLPVHWGGTATGPGGDEYCTDRISLGGKIDKKYYLKNQENITSLSSYEVGEVGRGSTLQLEYKVEEAGSVLRWNFWTNDKDIGFGIFRKSTDKRQKASEMETALESERVNCHMIPEDGSLLCYAAGTYVVRFDNTYSWVSSKKIHYRIEILAPDTNIKLFDEDDVAIDVRL